MPTRTWTQLGEDLVSCDLCTGNPVYRVGQHAWFHFYSKHTVGSYRLSNLNMEEQYGLPPADWVDVPHVEGTVGRLARSLQANLSYNAVAKNEFKLAARQALKNLARHMGIVPAVNCDIRWNEGGPAVSGSATLHHERFYIQVSQSPGCEVLYRTCQGRRDYSGGVNKFSTARTLDNPSQMAELIGRLVGGPVNRQLNQTAVPKMVDRGNGFNED